MQHAKNQLQELLSEGQIKVSNLKLSLSTLAKQLFVEIKTVQEIQDELRSLDQKKEVGDLNETMIRISNWAEYGIPKNEDSNLPIDIVETNTNDSQPSLMASKYPKKKGRSQYPSDEDED